MYTQIAFDIKKKYTIQLHCDWNCDGIIERKVGREIVVVIVCYSLLSGRRTDRCVQNGKCFQQD